MKKILLILAVFFCFLLLCYNVFFYFDRKSELKSVTQNKAVTRLNDTELGKLHEGDFILRRGFGFFSDYISTTLNQGTIDVTHAGILVKKGEEWFVIHSLSSDVTDVDGVQIQPLKTFLYYSEPHKIIVTRAKNANLATGKKVALLAEAYLQKQIPFDHTGIIDDDSELFCTELIWKILEKDLHHSTIPIDPKVRKKFFYTMTPMYSTDYFDIIINQYTD
jgi:hypothetical protein